ncbi:RNA ligase family protein [Halovivax gelatinilyticus]|uniref:RNA ligase family protein n=1 Tax=Halovivax gelatinilyticus TaxID=2961597 RepID=UPI0020CA390B|nr:RNA ligase family protein [Halovivax gelatinilyticus]
MHRYPPIPRAESAPAELFESGHLWLFEMVDGVHLRFQVGSSGLLRFGDRSTVFDDADDVPLPLAHAVRHVRRAFDRDALRRAVDDVTALTFFAEATTRQAIAYDWERLPPVLGFDVWSAETERFLPPDATEQVFDRLGLTPVTVVEREVRARDFDPSSYEIPASAWYDGPAAGVVVRNKRGGRAKILHPAFETEAEPEPFDADAETLAKRFATDDRFEKLARSIEAEGRVVDVDALVGRTMEAVAREEHARLFHGAASVDLSAFRAEVAALAGTYLADRHR